MVELDGDLTPICLVSQGDAFWVIRGVVTGNAGRGDDPNESGDPASTDPVSSSHDAVPIAVSSSSGSPPSGSASDFVDGCGVLRHPTQSWSIGGVFVFLILSAGALGLRH